MDTMFDTLLQLPLFQGLAREDLTNILGKVKLHFDKRKAGECLQQAGSPCDRFLFILKGEIASTTATADTDTPYRLTEHFTAPHLIEPHSLFGMSTRYASTHTAVEEVHLLSVSKSFILDELSKYEIFRLNFMNILCNRSQQLNRRIWSTAGTTPEERITHFIRTHCERPAGRKILKIKMEHLARLINESRLTVSKALNDMQARGLVELKRGEIVIPATEKL